MTGENTDESADGPARVTNARLFTVATAFTVAVVGLGFAGAVLPGFDRAAGLAVLACIAAYSAFGFVLVYRAGQRL
ncbi:hypothetical protein BRC78_06365 [Halobacteriales archaeon QH_8_68_33]|nr:MAG: hypothetical protein BRC78_06365 [Halobacteriales archaeon QH_8_68_33]